MIAKVALNAASGLNLEISEYLDALNQSICDEVADRAFNVERLREAMLKGEPADADMQGASTESYEALKAFMDKEKKRNKHATPGAGYVDFTNEMEFVPDEKGGVWVSKGNAQHWRDLHGIHSPPDCRR